MRFAPLENTLVIGIGHKARHGKDTVAQTLQQARPDLVQRFGVADALKSYARLRHGMTDKDPALLQRLGLELRDDRWAIASALYHTIREAAPRIAVIPDIRYPDDMALVEMMGGVLWKVSRLNADGSPFVDSSRDPNHVSETILDYREDWHAVLVASTVASLREQALTQFERLLPPAERRQRVVYVAGPFRASSTFVPGHQDMFAVQGNIMRAMDLALKVWKAGAVAVCPHANTMFYTGAADDSVWLDGDLELLRRSDAVIMTDDWRKSSGARAEHEFAKAHGIPVFYEMPMLDSWLRDDNTARIAA